MAKVKLNLLYKMKKNKCLYCVLKVKNKKKIEANIAASTLDKRCGRDNNIEFNKLDLKVEET